MNEQLLQFIWQFQYYNQQMLQTEAGEALRIVHPGNYNRHQGPDFLQATIVIGNVTLVGQIELHVLASDWHKHRHGNDGMYQNVVLHVVWQKDVDIKDAYNKEIPTLCLQNLVPKVLLQRYEQLMHQTHILCAPLLKQAAPQLDLVWVSWKERLLAERLEQRSSHILQLLAQSNHHWEAVCWWLMASNFGISVNKSLFEQVARSIDITILAKHKQQLLQLEALLLGQANFLEQPTQQDAYAASLQKEYRFLKNKYQLRQVYELPAMLRMRPAAFPTVRLAQLAALVHNSSHLFATFKEAQKLSEVTRLLESQASKYWDTHYVIGKLATIDKPKIVGSDMVENIVINTISPLLFAYGMYTKEEKYKEKAIAWLMQLPPEHNRLLKPWEPIGIENQHAADSQALIELTKNYCYEKRCLECAIGNRLLKPIT